MTSTSDSKQVVLQINNLDIGIKRRFDIHSPTFKKAFLRTAKNPLELFRSKDLGVEPLIQQINLTLCRGDRLAILGKNGVGKTTFCRTMAGMQGPRPEIEINGDVKVVFNTMIGIMHELSGRENMRLLARMLNPKLTNTQLNQMIQDSINFSELGEKIDHPFETYSNGMKARMFLSLVSYAPSDLLILDEVFTGADIFFGDKIIERFKNMIDQSKAVIFVSHSLEQIKEVCNRFMVIRGLRAFLFDDFQQAVSFYLEKDIKKNNPSLESTRNLDCKTFAQSSPEKTQ